MERSNEITAFAPLLERVQIASALITADALHSQRGHVQYRRARGAHWLLTVKCKQPELAAVRQALPWRQVPTGDRTVDVDDGRAETLTVQVAEVAGGIAFPDAALAIRITRTRRLPGDRRTTETIYALTDLTWSKINPGQIADALRSHWHCGRLLQ